MRISVWSSDVCSSDLNSGGGAVDGLEELAEAIYANSARFGGKPIWAMLADHSHSASYWLASAADKVFMPKLGTAGSIGAVILHAEMRSEEHTSELQSLMRISYAVFCLKKNTTSTTTPQQQHISHIHTPSH